MYAMSYSSLGVDPLVIVRRRVEKWHIEEIASRSVPFWGILHGTMFTMTTASIQLDTCSVELSQPLKDRPDVILIATSDGRRTVLGDGQDLISSDDLAALCGASEAANE